MKIKALSQKWSIFEMFVIGSWGLCSFFLANTTINFGNSLLTFSAFYFVSTSLSMHRSFSGEEPGQFSKKGLAWGMAAGLSNFGWVFCLAQALNQNMDLAPTIMSLVFVGALLVNTSYSIFLSRVVEKHWPRANLEFFLGMTYIAAAIYFALSKSPTIFVNASVDDNLWFFWASGAMLSLGTYGPNNGYAVTAMGESPARSIFCIGLTSSIVGAICTAFFFEGTEQISKKEAVAGMVICLVSWIGALGTSYLNKIGMQMTPKRAPIINMPIIFGGASFVSVAAALIHHPPGDWSFMGIFSLLLAMLLAGMVLCIRNNPAH